MVVAGLVGYVVGVVFGVLIGLNRAGRAYDRGQADLLEQQAAVRAALRRKGDTA